MTHPTSLAMMTLWHLAQSQSLTEEDPTETRGFPTRFPRGWMRGFSAGYLEGFEEGRAGGGAAGHHAHAQGAIREGRQHHAHAALRWTLAKPPAGASETAQHATLTKDFESALEVLRARAPRTAALELPGAQLARQLVSEKAEAKTSARGP